MNWNSLLTAIISGAAAGVASHGAHKGDPDYHEIGIAALVGAALGVTNLHRQSPVQTQATMSEGENQGRGSGVDA